MLRIKPLAIIAEGADQYRVRCHQDGGQVDFIFNMDPVSRGITKSQKEYYHVTYDDPAAEWLGRAILNLDEARFSGIALPQLGASTIERISLYADNDNGGKDKYRAVFEMPASTVEQSFYVSETDADITIATENGEVAASKKEGQTWKISCADPPMKPLLESILRLHQARKQ